MNSFSVRIKIRVAILAAALCFPLVDLCISGKPTWVLLFGPFMGILLAEIICRDVIKTIHNASRLLRNTWNIDLEGKDENDDLVKIKTQIKSVISNYSAKKRVETLLKKNQDLADRLNDEIVLHGSIRAGDCSVGEVWNKPTVLTDNNPSRQRSLSYRGKLRLWERCTVLTQQELERLEHSLLDRDEKGLAGIMRFQLLMLKDKSLQQQVKRRLSASDTLEEVIKRCFDEICTSLENPNPRLDRSADLRDLEQRLLNNALQTMSLNTNSELNLKGKVVLSKELMPSEFLQFYRQGACGFITLKGQETSHVHILQTSMNCPTISGIDLDDWDFPDGTTVLLNGSQGVAIFRPTKETMDSYRKMIYEKSFDDVAPEDHEPIVLDGQKITFRANLSVLSELEHIKSSGMDGIGLFRTELEFLLHPILPRYEEQKRIYQSIIKAFPDQSVTLRLLDSAIDKTGNHTLKPQEDNPSMGLYSIRFLLTHESLLREQMAAMIDALNEHSNGGTILVPMISSMEEVHAIHAIYKSELELKKIGHEMHKRIRLGMMVETPSIVMLFDKCIPYFDSFSIGTNDLVQYTLAADRNSSSVANIYNRVSPAVLRMIHSLVCTAQKHSKEISLCGEMGSNHKLLPLLIGLGVHTYSINTHAYPSTRRFVQQLSIEKCQSIATKALDCECEKDILALVAEAQG